MVGLFLGRRAHFQEAIVIASLVHRSHTLSRSDAEILHAVFDEICLRMSISRRSADAERVVDTILDFYNEGENQSGDLTQKVLRFWRAT